jgi:type IV secretory pathway VirB2 component (pilin)
LRERKRNFLQFVLSVADHARVPTSRSYCRVSTGCAFIEQQIKYSVQGDFMKRLQILSILLCGVTMVFADLSGMWMAVAEKPISATSTLLAQDNAQGSDQAANVAGTWQLSFQGRRGTMQATLTIQQNGTKVSGTLAGLGRMRNGSSPLTGNIEGSNLSFSVPGGRMPLTFKGTLDGDTMSGTMQQGTPWTATRQEQ